MGCQPLGAQPERFAAVPLAAAGRTRFVLTGFILTGFSLTGFIMTGFIMPGFARHSRRAICSARGAHERCKKQALEHGIELIVIGVGGKLIVLLLLCI